MLMVVLLKPYTQGFLASAGGGVMTTALIGAVATTLFGVWAALRLVKRWRSGRPSPEPAGPGDDQPLARGSQVARVGAARVPPTAPGRPAFSNEWRFRVMLPYWLAPRQALASLRQRPAMSDCCLSF